MGAIRARVAIGLALVLALEVVLDHPGRSAIATGPDGVTYVHDAAGRLIAAIDPLTDAALYSYDGGSGGLWAASVDHIPMAPRSV